MDGLIRDRPGFEVDLCSRGSFPETAMASPVYEVLIVHRGHWRLSYESGEEILAPGDTCAVAPGLAYTLAPSMSGEASVFRVRPTPDKPGSTAM